MTREEFEQKSQKLKNCMIDKRVSDLLSEYIDSLEQRIAELEYEFERLPIFSSASDKKYIELMEQRIVELESPKTCEGCELYEMPREWSPCNVCIRYCADYYEPKKDTE